MLTVANYNPAGLPEVLDLAEAWEFKPYRGHAAWPDRALVRLTAARVRRACESSPCSFVARSGNRITAIVITKCLPWDTAQLGFPCARIEFLLLSGTYPEKLQQSCLLLAAAEKQLRSAFGIKHLMCRLDAADVAAVHGAERSEYLQMDGLVVFGRGCDTGAGAPAALHNGFRLRFADPSDSTALAEIARTAYSASRFHADPHIGTAVANELHAEWVRNSCTRVAADAVVMAEDPHGPCGYLTCQIAEDTREHLGSGIGTIVLVATAARVRGCGLGKAMTALAMQWFREHGCSIIEVGTQLANLPAFRLYESCGFRAVASQLTLHKCL